MKKNIKNSHSLECMDAQHILSSNRSEDAETTSSRIKCELSQSYFSDSNWLRYGLQLSLDLGVERESVFDQIRRIRSRLVFNRVKAMLRRGENYLSVYTGLVSFLDEHHLHEQFKEISLDASLMIHQVNGSSQHFKKIV